MRRATGLLVTCLGCAFVWLNVARAQGGRGAADWTTGAGDAQRSFWVRTDAKISKESMQKPGFQFLWKLKLDNDPRQLNSLTPPVLLERYIGYRGFRSLAFVGGSSDKVFAIDTDLGRIEWQNRFSSASPTQDGSLVCPGGMTANLTRPTVAAPPAAPAGRGGGGFGRGVPARSGVGEAGQGAVTLGQAGAARGVGAGFPVAPGVPGAPGPPAFPGGPGGFGRMPTLVYALSSDGMLHSMYVSNGADAEPPARFIPANAHALGLIVVDNVAYAATARGCGGVANGVWALDLATKQVSTWKSNGGGIAGSAGPAFGPEGILYVATGERERPLVALEPKTLKLKDWYAAGQDFTASPVVFAYKEKNLIAATTQDGRMHLLDGATLGGADHQTPLCKTPVYSNAADFVPGALASWQDSGGTRWVLAPAAGPVASDAGFTLTNGNVTHGAIVAWKVVDESGAPALQPAWVSRDLVSPLPPMVINGVVFAVSSGELRSDDSQLSAAQRAERSSRAVVYALDATTGKELWSSGDTITSFLHGGGLSGGASQLYLGTYDGTLYAFGFPIEH
jgi:outer membrane protein assembly factor BamB